ncbi:two-component sensor histidine kinase [Saccharibacillus sp. O23]|uniref:cache domain-containing sensor histidine kinase n=1 Tax=Saccharibacillus sp. O23 TaxID=2009338 RepID=UPI000B4E157E|nr:sensor histidine kinase [Saccharibacillus sp. O23]OWR29569.1 two-component sensor histidine kinase [Saccharibacillus sp. O23]
MKRTRSFRFRLFASYVLLTAIPLLVLGTLFYRTSLKVVTDQAQDNVYEIVRKNNQLMDTKLRILDQNSMALFTDKDLFELFNDLDPTSGSELLAADRQVSDVLRNYFSQFEDVYAYQLWTSYFTFGQQLPQGDPTRSEVYRTAEQAGGKLVWYPTYDFAAMFGQPDYAEDNIDFRYLFSATRVLDFSYLYNSILRRLDEGVERPVLVISLKYEALNKLFAGSLPDRSRYLVLDPDNRVAASDDASLVSRVYGEPWIEDLQRLGSGRKRMILGGERVIVCFDRSQVTGWLSVVITPEASLIRDLVPVIRTSTLVLAVVMTAAALALAYFISGKINKPVRRLTEAMRSAGEGDFDARVPVTSDDEFGRLLGHFNRMNDRIGSLVTEVYETRLKEQEAEIQALNRQMNPHFLYNTLNVMNWMALENDQRELSRMLVCLSNMLHYTSRREWGAVSLSEEIEWMNSYFYIMQARFENKFAVEYELVPELFEYELPRLTFQPFVENAILHGFEEMETGGLIVIRGKTSGDERIYEVEDNGKGMDAETVDGISNGQGASVGIRNTTARIRMQYGSRASVSIESSPGRGTLITIRLPRDSQT